ncbi:MAG: molybdopterin-dependent oxidoreductase [Pseudomonadota bacterium]
MNLAAICIWTLGTVSLAAPTVAQELKVSTDTSDASYLSFDLDQLDALPQTSFQTETIWTEGMVEFSGVALAELLKASGSKGDSVRMIALNDYSIEMPMAEVGDEFPIVATRMNGETMSVRDKGPYWLVYPYDTGPEYQTEVIYSRSIWQLSELAVID